MKFPNGETTAKAFVIIFLNVIVYGFTLDGDFVFDDSEAIVKNKDVSGSVDLVKIFRHDFWGANITSSESHKSYRPLTVLTFRLNFYMNNNTLDAYQMKLTNLLLHIACCLLIWQSYKQIINFSKFKNGIDIPFYAALIFSVHPVHTEAVSGIVGRADLLSGICFFSAILMYVHKVRTKKKYFFLVCTICFGGVGMMFKETGITVLGFCITFDIIKSVFKTDKNKLYLSKMFLVKVVTLLTSGIIFMVLRFYIMGLMKPKFQDVDNPAAFADDFSTRLLTHTYIHFLNLLLLIWPEWLCFDWSMGCVQLLQSLGDLRVICVGTMYIYFALIVRYLIVGKSAIAKRSIATSLALLVLPFIPASNLFFTVGFVIAERLLYIPSAGFCLLIAIGANRIATSPNGRYEKIVMIAYTTLLVTFGARSYARSREWRNERELFNSGLRVCPNNAKVSYNIAKVTADEGDLLKAVDMYEHAIKLYPKYYQAMNNLANILKDMKRSNEAEAYLRIALKYKRDFPAAWMNLGIVLANLGRSSESEEAYLMALHFRSNYPHCLYNLGNLYLEKGDHKRAKWSYRRAISQQPDLEMAWSNLLALLDNTGETHEAMELVPSALKVQPRSGAVHFVTANLYGKSGDFQNAERHFLKAIECFGDKVQPIHFSNLGVLYHRWKKYKKAEMMYRKALQINPEFKTASENLEKVLHKINNYL